MSSANARLRTSSVMALPPYFTTTILLVVLLQPGQRRGEDVGPDALGVVFGHEL